MTQKVRKSNSIYKFSKLKMKKSLKIYTDCGFLCCEAVWSTSCTHKNIWHHNLEDHNIHFPTVRTLNLILKNTASEILFLILKATVSTVSVKQCSLIFKSHFNTPTAVQWGTLYGQDSNSLIPRDNFYVCLQQ